MNEIFILSWIRRERRLTGPSGLVELLLPDNHPRRELSPQLSPPHLRRGVPAVFK
jgi:hypothetical protein